MLLDDISMARRIKQIDTDHFVHTATWNPLGAGATTPVQVQFQNDSDFIICKQMITAYSAVGVLVLLPDYLVTILLTGTGRQYQDAPQHVGNAFGTAQLPYILPEPKLVPGGSQMTVTLQNLTAVAARVDISFSGMKVFYKAGVGRDILSWI